jgi:G3E family GTPase
MNLRELHPGDLLDHPETGIQELMRIFLMRTNFVPGIRHVIGWRGVKDSSRDILGWTARIGGASGIYGISFEACHTFGDWIRGQFILCYFPDPDEDLVDQLSIQAGILTQRDDYFTWVRDFLKFPDRCDLFTIARIDLCARGSADALLLGLESPSRQRTVAHEGITVVRDGRSIELVAPGGYDQDFPAYSTAFAFFRVYAASVTFNLDEPPVYCHQAHRKGEEIVCTSKGDIWTREPNSTQDRLLYLSYGAVTDKTAEELIGSTHASDAIDMRWEKDDDAFSEYDDELWWNAHVISDYKTLDKSVLGIDERPQLIVVTGFLGSGKTTFVRNFIEYHVQHNRFVAVIQNEIGEINLDSKLLDHDYSVIEIDEGCVCCTLIGSLKKGIMQILARFHPDYIIVETTGLANPFNLLDELSEIEDVVKFDSVTTVVDSVNVDDSLKKYTVAHNQIAAADILLVNKKDLVTDEELSAINQTLREINETAPLIPVTQGDINPVLLYGIDQQDLVEIQKREDRRNVPTRTDTSHEKDGLQSITIPISRSLDRDRFIEIITSLPNTFFRMKGILDFNDSAEPHLFQYVNGRFEFSELHNPSMAKRFITVIGQNMEKEPINKFLHILRD